MSSYSLPQYRSRKKNLKKFVKYLALNRDTTQFELTQELNCSTRTTIRLLNTLRFLGLAKISAKKRQNGVKRGKPRNLWNATFGGLMLALFLFLESEDFKKNFKITSKCYENDWIIFKEWNYLSKKEKIVDFLFQRISMLVSYHSSRVSGAANGRSISDDVLVVSRGFDRTALLYRDFHGLYRSSKEMSSGLSDDELKEWDNFLNYYNEETKEDITYDILGLDDFLLGNSNRDIIEYFMNNKRLKKLILTYYEREKKTSSFRVKSIQEFELNYGIE